MRDYPSLLTDIPAWLDNETSDLAAQLPLIISEAEDRIYREAFSHAMDATTDGTGGPQTIAGGAYVIPIPADMIQPRHLRVVTPSGLQILKMKSLDFCIQCWPNFTATDGTNWPFPAYFAIQDASNFRIAPTAAGPTSYTLAYKRRLPSLSGSNTSNWLTQNAYGLLRAECLRRAAMFIIDDRQDSLVQKYEANYQAELDSFNSLYPRSMLDEYRAMSAISLPVPKPLQMAGIGQQAPQQ